MKKYVMLGVWMMAATLLIAQPHSKQGHQHSGKNADKMKTELSLSDEQYASIKKINEKYAGRRLALRHDSTTVADQRIAEVKALKAEREKEIDAVLTPDQKTKWTALREARAEKMKARKYERQTQHSAHLKELLSLSDDQQASMKAARTTFSQKAGQIRDDDSLTRDDKVTEIRKLKNNHEEAVKSILTEDQFKKWNALKAKQHFKGKSKHK